jgi:guanosine-3',5'-bis(diphosphate) 3'-pyrophosphohydrolase
MLKEKSDAIQCLYQRAIIFADSRHGEQKMLDGRSYLVHLSNVAMEIIFAAGQTENFNLQLALPVALLHDILEDTETREEELLATFGLPVTRAVRALTKDFALPKAQQMGDSLRRIQIESKEVAAVKLADRITNLQPPPAQWSKTKIMEYREEALVIHTVLKDANVYLAKRLMGEIEKYAAYCG